MSYYFSFAFCLSLKSFERPKASTNAGIFFLLTALEIDNNGGNEESLRKGSSNLLTAAIFSDFAKILNRFKSTPGEIVFACLLTKLLYKRWI